MLTPKITRCVNSYFQRPLTALCCGSILFKQVSFNSKSSEICLKYLQLGDVKKNLMNEQKRSELYSMGKSLNEKSGRQAFGGGRGRERETDAG